MNNRVFDFPDTVSVLIVAMVIKSLSRSNKLEVILIYRERLKAMCNTKQGKSLYRASIRIEQSRFFFSALPRYRHRSCNSPSYEAALLQR